MPEEDLDYNTIVDILTKREEEEANREKRRKPDLLTILPAVLSWTSALLVAAVWILLDQVGPPAGSNWGWLSLFGHTPVTFKWPRGPVNVAYITLIISVVFCVTAFICNRMRMRRKGDKYKVSIFIVGAVALVTLVVFLVNFLPMGILG